jgi:glycosyltransferase involved in cell wall biosynthesis
MRILVLSPLVPALGGSGGHTREAHLLARLAERGHEVAVCCPVPPGQAAMVDAARRAGLEVRGADRPSSRVAEVLAALRRRPGLAAAIPVRPLASWQLEVLWEEMRDDVRAELAGRPDVALVIWDLAAAWRAHLPDGLPTVLACHDASWDYIAARARRASGARRAALGLEARRLRGLARRWLPRYDGVVCVSEDDAQRIRALDPALRPEVVPNGVDLRGFAAVPEVDGPPTVLFTGTMNYHPNTEGALWLAREAWPVVRRRSPGARLLIVGREPPRAVRALDGADGITVTGAVPAMAPYFASAHVVAVPILSGGGTRLKLLEAAAAGRPVVSTTRGAEGLALHGGRELLLADEPASFAAAVTALLEDPQRRRALAVAAREVVAARYGWPALGDRLAELLERVAARTPATTSAGTASSTSSASTT